MTQTYSQQHAKPCTHYLGAQARHCGGVPTRRYICGPRCAAHTPAALAGQPEPGQRAYCPPARCLCGQPDCPAYATYGAAAYQDGETVVDVRAKASGKRRASVEEYRAAQATVGEQQERDRHLRLVSSLADGAGDGKTGEA